MGAVTVAVVVIFVPPLRAVYQPLNVCPLHVGVGRLPMATPFATFLLAGDTEPPFASNATLTMARIARVGLPLSSERPLATLGPTIPPPSPLPIGRALPPPHVAMTRAMPARTKRSPQSALGPPPMPAAPSPPVAMMIPPLMSISPQSSL